MKNLFICIFAVVAYLVPTTQVRAAEDECLKVINAIEADYQAKGRVLVLTKELTPLVLMGIYMDMKTEMQYAVLLVLPGGTPPPSGSPFKFSQGCIVGNGSGAAKIYVASNKPVKA